MYQKLIIAGHLGGDPQLRYTPTGQAVASFGVATNRRWTDQAGEARQETVWFRVSVWGRLAEACCRYLHQGRLVLCEGRLTADPATGGPRLWKGADGLWRAGYELTATEVRFLSGRYEDHTGDVPASAEELPVADQAELAFS